MYYMANATSSTLSSSPAFLIPATATSAAISVSAIDITPVMGL